MGGAELSVFGLEPVVVGGEVWTFVAGGVGGVRGI